MADVTLKSDAQEESEAEVDVFRQNLGPFVVAAEKTRMPMIFTNVEPTHPVIFANDAFLRLTGYERDEVLGKNFQSLLAVGADPGTAAIVEAALRGENSSEPEMHYKRKNGSEFWVSIYISPVCDESGAVVQQFVSFIDVTKHRQEDARNKMLIGELNHRVKNTLATAQAIVTQSLRRPAEPAAIQEAIESRILALSRSHDLLSSRNWEGVCLHDLVDTVLQPFEVVAGLAQRITVTGINVQLSPKTTLSLAIALHELATNAVKYGAFSKDVGTISIDWTVVPEAAGDRLVLRWRERNGPPVTPPMRKGFGSWVIEHGLAYELGGKVTLEYLEHGLACTIDMPAPAEAHE